MLSRRCMASTFSWWWSLSSCFCANLWIVANWGQKKKHEDADGRSGKTTL